MYLRWLPRRNASESIPVPLVKRLTSWGLAGDGINDAPALRVADGQSRGQRRSRHIAKELLPVILLEKT